MSSEARHRFRIAALVAVAGTVVAVAWAAIVAVSFWSDVQDLPRTDIPGALTVDLTDTGTRYVYYERRELLATVPVEVELDVQVTDPAGRTVQVTDHDGFVNYRLLRLVGQSHASFDATIPGQYTVSTTDPAPHEGATVAVGENMTGSLLRGLIGPAIAFIASIILAGTITAAGRR